MIRFFDFVFALLGILFLWPIALFVCILIALENGKPVYRQVRVGRHKKPFTLYKFRTMKVGTASVATHLSNQSDITRLGRILRKTKIDELPQLINVLKGEMSIVGPRPNLFSQTELIHERDIRGVYEKLPGITGLGQINGIDMSRPKVLAELDAEMCRKLNTEYYFKYIIATFLGNGFGDRIGGSDSRDVVLESKADSKGA